MNAISESSNSSTVVLVVKAAHGAGRSRLAIRIRTQSRIRFFESRCENLRPPNFVPFSPWEMYSRPRCLCPWNVSPGDPLLVEIASYLYS
jgi:hypothetical protein